MSGMIKCPDRGHNISIETCMHCEFLRKEEDKPQLWCRLAPEASQNDLLILRENLDEGGMVVMRDSEKAEWIRMPTKRELMHEHLARLMAQ